MRTVVPSSQLHTAPVPAEAMVSKSSKSVTSHVASEQVSPRHQSPAGEKRVHRIYGVLVKRIASIVAACVCAILV